jgi:hypothetical protein
MILAIRIWLKLRNSIPLRYREYYSLLPDPAAGKVTVVARTPSLELPGLWSTKAGRHDFGKASLPKRKTALPCLADHVAFVPIAPAVSGSTVSRFMTNGDGIMMSCRSFSIPRQGFLGRTWMALADQCAMKLDSPQGDENAYGTKLEREEENEVRFSVESDMNANAPTPLRMTWAQFVWLSLALGVRPYDAAWHGSYPCTLKDKQGNALITLFESDGQLFARVFTERDISYSLNRAFAWHNVIMDTEGLWPLGSQRKTHVPLSAVQISPSLSTLLNTDELERDADNVLRGKEAQDCEDPLASACRWMLYHRRYRSITGDSIPVSQQMMEMRERALCQLHLLDKKGQLEAMIQLLVRTPEPKELVAIGNEKIANNESQGDMRSHTAGLEKICVGETPIGDQADATVVSADASHEQNRHVPLEIGQSELDPQAINGQNLDKREPEPRDGSRDQANSLASATQVEQVSSIDPDDAHADSDRADGHYSRPNPHNVTSPQSTYSITSSRTGPAGGISSANVDAQDRNFTAEPVTQFSTSQLKAVSTILDAICSVIAASNYVQRYERLLYILKEIVHGFIKLSESGAELRALYKLQPKSIANAIENDAVLSPALARLARFSVVCAELDTLTDHKNRRSKITDIYDLLPHIHRARLEDAALATPSPSSVVGFDGSDDTSFIASIALATADWDTAIHQAWRLNIETMSRYEALTLRWRENVLRFGHNQEKRLDIQQQAQLDIEVEATNFFNDGLYNAPESSELDILLTKEIRKVCLL